MKSLRMGVARGLWGLLACHSRGDAVFGLRSGCQPSALVLEGPRPVISFPVTAVHVDPDMPHALSILTLLTPVPDPRHRRGRRHRLEVILALEVAAVQAVEASAWDTLPLPNTS